MSDPVILSLSGNSDERDRLGVYDDFAADENQPGDFVPGLVNLGFLKAAIRRSVLFVSLMAAVGLVGGIGVYAKYPHSYQATASLFLTISPYEDTLTAVANNQAMAATSPVATIALKKLGLNESVSNFLSSYTVASSTARVLTVTGSGPSPEQAQLRTGAVGNAFLTFRANELQAQQDLVVQSLNQQINQASEACQFDRRADQPAIKPVRFTRATGQGPSGTNRRGERAVQPSASRCHQPDDHPADPDGGVEEQPGPERHPGSSTRRRRSWSRTLPSDSSRDLSWA